MCSENLLTELMTLHDKMTLFALAVCSGVYRREDYSKAGVRGKKG